MADFYDYTTFFDAIRPKLTWQEFYSQTLKEILEDGFQFGSTRSQHPSCFNQGEAERLWFFNKKPYYKVFPDVLPWIFEAARLDIPNELLHSPFSTILIRLPKDHRFDFLSIDDQHFARCILITETREGELIDLSTGRSSQPNNIIIWVDFGEREDLADFPLYSYQYLSFHKGMTVEESLQIAQSKTEEDMPGIVIPNEIMTNCLRLCAAVCFLATGADRIVEVDVLNRDMLRYAQADEERQKVIRQRAIRLGKHGWTVGRDRELIFPSRSRSSEESQSTGRHTHQHQRSGHFHVVRYGKGREDAKVQWYRQLTVRPDLPAPPAEKRRGYKSKR